MLDNVGSNLKTVTFFVQHLGCCMILYLFGHVQATLAQRACVLAPGAWYTLTSRCSAGLPTQYMSQHHATMLQDVALKCCELWTGLNTLNTNFLSYYVTNFVTSHSMTRYYRTFSKSKISKTTYLVCLEQTNLFFQAVQICLGPRQGDDLSSTFCQHFCCAPTNP